MPENSSMSMDRPSPLVPASPYWTLCGTATMRKTCMVELLGGRSLRRFSFIRQQEIGCFLRVMMASAGEPVDVSAKFGVLTGNILVRMATGRTIEKGSRVLDLVQEASEIGGQFYLGDYSKFMSRWDVQGYKKKCRDIHERLDGLMEEVVKEHQSRRMEKTVEGKDIIDVLLKSIKEDKEEGGLTEEDVKSLILDVYVGGFHTASIPLQFGLMELVRHPSVLLKAQEEMDSVVGKKRLVEERDLANLPYLEAIVKETLRLHPPVPMVPRASTEDCRVGEYDIPANTWVFVNVWAMGKDPCLWDSPSEFRPERFLGSPVNVKGEYFELLPFGSGLRMCPGSAHALLVFRTVLACLIQCFDWEVDGGPKRLDVEERSAGMTVSMANKLICRPIPRFDALIVEYKSANESLNYR
ncbi:beta-amyrin 24-hydroxylase-like isoform X1 [Nymphaea colorata]|nr:beta-amyrin 24-hydroxylase-like isoform X1 [Nymphaea colorata]